MLKLYVSCEPEDNNVSPGGPGVVSGLRARQTSRVAEVSGRRNLILKIPRGFVSQGVQAKQDLPLPRHGGRRSLLAQDPPRRPHAVQVILDDTYDTGLFDNCSSPFLDSPNAEI